MTGIRVARDHLIAIFPCRHISWLEEKGLNGQESYPNALKKCIAYFGQIPHYNSDIRLAEIYIKLVSPGGCISFS